LEFDIAGELGEYDSQLLDKIHAGNYAALHIDTNIKNLESLEYLKIELHDVSGNMLTYTQYISKEELEMYDNTIKINLPDEINTLQKIVFIPIFRSDQEYSNDNDIGITRIQTIEVNGDLLSYSGNDIEYIDIELEYDLIINNTNSGYELAYVFNERLEHLIFPESTPIVYDTLNDDNGDILSYILRIPKQYIKSITNETTSFKTGEIFAIRYNSPVKKGISMAIGKMYFENNYHPDIKKAQLMFINADTSQSYSQFTEDYYYSVPLRLTPYDTETSGRFKAVRIDLNFTSLYELIGEDTVDFSNLVFSVPNPCYELTINEIVIIKDAYEPTPEYGSDESRVWQYSEIEMFQASNNPTQDCYQLSLETEPLFYPNTEWIEYLNIFDEDGNYYSAGITGDQYQLLYNQDNQSFTWNPEFNQFPSYFGMEWEEPLMIAPNKSLYFQYCTPSSWTEPIRIDKENIDLESIRVVYQYNNLLRPEHYDWYHNYFKPSHSYENIAYSFRDEVDYSVTQYYHESFTVYRNASIYTHTFDIGDLNLQEDFINLGLYKIVGLTPTFETEILTNNENYNIHFNKNNNSLTVENIENTGLNKFDLITVVLNYSHGPISSYSEIELNGYFNETYLQDPMQSFYGHVDIDFNYINPAGQVLFAENSDIITSEITSFIPISYCPNPDISNNYELMKYQLDIYDKFELYLDDSSVIYEADLNLDGEPEYKHEIDLDQDYIVDVIKYGIPDPENEGQIIWHTIIQKSKGYESKLTRESEPREITKWFDIDDRIFATYEFNLAKLIPMLLLPTALIEGVAKMILPDVDYWAQKSEQREVTREEFIQYNFYSITVDNDCDGYSDQQMSYERNDVSIDYEVKTFKKTILAAKNQNLYNFITAYIERSVKSFITDSRESLVFNDGLTEDILDSGDFSECNWHVRYNEQYLEATYRKFTENISTIYTESYSQEKLTITDYNEEEIEEQRVYIDDFKSNEVDELDQYFKIAVLQHQITNVDTGEALNIEFDPILPYTNPLNITWTGETWGSDDVPIKLDSLHVFRLNGSYTTNYFEKQLYIRIPNRYSLYNDYGIQSRDDTYDSGYAQFLTKGILITPQDGEVYYTGDIEAFIDGSAKTEGHYFFVDTNEDGFFESIYILSALNSTAEDGTPCYDVISIGFNYDGIHDFVPYEKIKENSYSRTDIYGLSQERVSFGSDWLYNFGKLKNVKLLFPNNDEIWENYRPKDHIFEIYKLIDISKNPKFSALFYEVRHKTYSMAWNSYFNQLANDIAEQVFTVTLTATISACVESVMLVSVILAPYAHITATATYFAIYTLLTKFFIDGEIHESDSRTRAFKFYPVDRERKGTTSLNERSYWDRILKDSTIAAMIGHPGGYYRTVSGGPPEERYTAQLLVSPDNGDRIERSLGGFFEFLAENLFSMGESDPDTFTALDFDDFNIDYFLLSNELYAYNGRSHYTFRISNFTCSDYNDYRENTLGALQDMVRTASNGELNAIRPTCVNGVPEYEFINKDSQQYQGILPLTSLYRPIVVSEERYSQIIARSGHLTINAQGIDYNNSLGIYAYDLNLIESQFYRAKIPINENGFDYPITNIYIDVVENFAGFGDSYLCRYLMVNTSYFVVDDGNLYLTKSLEEIVSEQYGEIEDLTSSEYSQIYYKIHIIFDLIVADTSEETHQLALAQGTTYAIMDYFNQYTYAEVSANMIAEIAYTETLTFWSTYISAPAAYFASTVASAAMLSGLASAGSMLAKSALEALVISFKRNLIKTLFTMFVAAPIKEVFEEIIKDGLIETLAESFVDFMGGTEDMAYWLSSLGTSFREVKGPIGQLVLGGDTNLQTQIALVQAIEQGDIDTILEIEERLEKEREDQLALESDQEEMKYTWKKILSSKFFKCAILAIPTLFYAPLGLGTINKMFDTMGKWVSKSASNIYGKIESKIQAFRKNRISSHSSISIGLEQQLSVENLFLRNMEEQMKKPSELDDVQLNALFRGQQEIEVDNMPICIIFPEINPNPKEIQKNELVDNFNEIRAVNDKIKLKTENIVDPYSKQKLITTHNNIDTIKRVGKYSEIVDTGDYESFTAEKIMTVKEFLKAKHLFGTNINLGVLVNGKKVSLDYIISPNDDVAIMPHIGGNAHNNVNINDPRVNEIIDKINRVLDSGSSKKCFIFLTEEEREYLLNYYKGLSSGLFQQNEWNPNEPSPYVPHLKFLIDEMVILLFELEIIDKKTYTAIEDLKIYGNRRLSYVIDGLKSTSDISKFKVGEETLDKWFVRIENIINTYYETQFNMLEAEYNIGLQIEKENKLFAVHDFFNSFYSLFGFTKENRFYRDARIMLISWGEILRLADLPEFKDNRLQNLEDFIGRDTHQIYRSLVRNPFAIPDIKAVIRLESDIETALNTKTEFSPQEIEAIMNEIQSITQQYINIIQNYLKGEDLLKNLPDGPRKRLLQDIIHYPYNNILEGIQDRKILSKLLFGGEYDQIGKFTHEKKRVELKKLFQIKIMVEQWSLKTFKELKIDITKNLLIDLKLYINNIIDDFIFNNPEYDYVSDSVLRFGVFHNKDFLKKEYRMIYNIWRVFAISYEDPKISFKKIQKEVDIGYGLTRRLRGEGANYNIGTGILLKYLNKIQGFLSSENDIQKRELYQEAIDTIKHYAADRHLGYEFYQETKDIRGDYNHLWYQNWYKSTLIILGLARLGGINPLTCEPIEATLFDSDHNTEGGVFQPHHFSVREKHLLLVGRIFILNSQWHGRFNTLAQTSMGVQLQLQLRDAILSLMESDKKFIDENDIRQAFGDLEIFGKRVSDWWIKDDDYVKNIARFNQNRELIKQGNIFEFIDKNFELEDESNPVLERFWNAMKETMSGFLMLHDDFDFSYLFTQKDMEFIRKTFKLENISS